MGGAPRFKTPNTWTPSGGYWWSPRGWQRNTAVAFGITALIGVGLFQFSIKREKFSHANVQTLGLWWNQNPESAKFQK